ncbi:hypothetical protein [Pantoea sp. Acro-807]|uniref:hypothetical protein n=1 Tax=Pantoea sp. Acro-807 TaxID=2608356 RepID=UPI00141A2DE2|nr:hypothetical protein [Pantoea sp. Acro-807]NIE72337.1 hypothetical protein [Pantoea sp. Acro-807]
MMIPRVESQSLQPHRAASCPDNKLYLPANTGNSDKAPVLPFKQNNSVAPGAAVLKLLKKNYGSIPMEKMRELEKLIEKGEVDNKLTEGDKKLIYKFDPGKIKTIDKEKNISVPQDFISDLGRGKLYINYNDKRESIKNLADFKRVYACFTGKNSAVMEIISVACCQSFFADNWCSLEKILPKSFFSSNGDQEYKLEVWIDDRKEKGNCLISQRVHIRGDVTYKISYETERGDQAEIKNLQVKGAVNRDFYYQCPAPDTYTNVLQNDFEISYIPDSAKSRLAFEVTENNSSDGVSNRGRSHTQPAIPIKDRHWASDTFKSGEDDTSYSTESTSTMSDFLKEDEGSMPPIPKVISSDTGFMTSNETISQPWHQNSKPGTKPSFFARIRQAWSDITETVVSYWQRLKTFFSF